MIPEQWEEGVIGTLIDSLEAGVSVNSEDRHREANEVGVLKTSAVTYGIFDPLSHKAVLSSESNRVRVNPRKDNIIISRMNTLALVGASAYVEDDYPALFLPDRLWQTRRSSRPFSMRWLSYVLATDMMRRRIASGATGTSGSMKNISQSTFLNLRILIPPLPEQHKIAEILGTWDEAIRLTADLIAAKQQRKKGLMQRLLSGEVRFPGFAGLEWRETSIGVVAEVTAGGTPGTTVTEYWHDGTIPWMRSGEVHKKRIYSVGERITQSGMDNSNAKLIPMNSVLIALAGQGRTRGTVAINKIELTTNQSIAAMIPDAAQVDYEFLFYDLDSRYDELRRLSAGDGGRGGLNLSLLKQMVVRLPPLEEQKKIAMVLEACDDELALLQQKLALLQQQKKGLMQRLLTGQVRVKISDQE